MAFSVASIPAFATDDNKADNYIEGEVIVVLKENADRTYMMRSKAAASYGKGISLEDSYSFDGGQLRATFLKSNTLSTNQMLKKLKANDAVKYAFPNHKVKAAKLTDDTYIGYQWALHNGGQNNGTPGFDTKAYEQWEDAEDSEEEQVVAIVDTGIDPTHEDLKDVLWVNPYGSKLIGKNGCDFTDTIEDGSPYDDNGHGSHCAGIIAATANNQVGISGINQSNVKIMACKFLESDGSGSTDAALAAYEYIERAMDLGTNVVAINNSWGGAGEDEELQLWNDIFDRVGKKGALSVIAAGNEASNVDEKQDTFFFGEMYSVPAATTSNYAITVAASNGRDELASFSNYGKEVVDIASPGTEILSTVSYNCFNPTIYNSTQRNELCRYYQDYEIEPNPSEFGSIKRVELDNGDVSNNYDISMANDGFALSDKSIKVTTHDAIVGERYKGYIFEIPFRIEDESRNYAISFMDKGNNGAYGAVIDVPADFDTIANWDSIPGSSRIDLYYSEVGNYWSHRDCVVDVNDTNSDIPYQKATNRKLVFYVETPKDNTTIQIDDLAISYQFDGEAPSQFGKYDFYNGTSMATPYVTGAAALLNNVYNDASPAEVKNIIENTGRYSPALEGLTKNAKVLCLDSIEEVPPMITEAYYNYTGDVELRGAFKDITSVRVNGEETTPISVDRSILVLPDNNYNTKKCTITVINEFGEDEITTLLSKKMLLPELTEITGTPDIYPGLAINQGGIMVPAGDNAYFISEDGIISKVSYDYGLGEYEYDDACPSIDFLTLFGVEDVTYSYISDAVYLDGRIYFTAYRAVVSQQSEQLLGYEDVFGYVDLEEGFTMPLCTCGNDFKFGTSLAVFNGDIYLLGGYSMSNSEFSKEMYKFNTDTNDFDLLATELPQGRAFTKFLQFKNRLVGVYGAQEDGNIPRIINYDGAIWGTTATDFESDDFYEFHPAKAVNLKVYEGNVGYYKTGLFCNGAYVYNVGDTFAYNVTTDTVIPSRYSTNNAIVDSKIIGTTLPGRFVGFRVTDNEEIDYANDGAIYAGEGTAYALKFKNSYAKLNLSEINANAYVKNVTQDNYNYGDKAYLDIRGKNGYVVTAIKANNKVVSDTHCGYAVMDEDEVLITVSVKKVIGKVTGLKLTSAGSTTYTLSWDKTKDAKGYLVQQLKNGAWKTIKKITLGDTTKYAVKKTAGTNKFRVKAYTKYDDLTVYGTPSATYSVYVPGKQTITSVSGQTKAFTVKYKKNTNATGYQIQYATSSKFTSAKSASVTKNTTISKKITKLTAKKKYYVRVRSYKLTEGKKVYGAWSAYKSVTTK
jgi:subtilisin family serine protease